MSSIYGHTGERNAWIDIDCAALQANAALLRSHLDGQASSAEIIAVIKADGYGHGAAHAARAFARAGVKRFAVTSLDEAAELVSSGFDAHTVPLLVFAPVVTPDQAAYLCEIGAEATVCDAHHLRLLINAAEGADKRIAIHLKVDTGLGRLGEPPSEAIGIARLVAASDRLTVAGVYTHFARSSEPSLAPTKRQLAAFVAFIDRLKSEGIQPGICHAANSAATLRLPESRLDAVRLGTILYGQTPSQSVPTVPGLNPNTWSAKARIVFVHHLPAHAHVGYGAEARLARPSRIAIIAVGYADGYGMSPDSLHRGRRALSSLSRQLVGRDTPFVKLQGQAAPVLGRIAMQMIAVDTTDLSRPVEEGDIAEVPMRRLAASARLARVYHGE